MTNNADQPVHPQITIRSANGKDSMISFEKKSDSSTSFKMGLKDESSDFVIEKQGESLL